MRQAAEFFRLLRQRIFYGGRKAKANLLGFEEIGCAQIQPNAAGFAMALPLLPAAGAKSAGKKKAPAKKAASTKKPAAKKAPAKKKA